MSTISFDVPAMLRAGGRLDAVAGLLDGAAASVGNVSTAGFPPELASLTRTTTSEAQCALRSASRTTLTQGEDILSRAGRVLLADAAGGGLDLSPFGPPHAWKGKGGGSDPHNIGALLDDVKSGVPAAGLIFGVLNTARNQGREWLDRYQEASRDLNKANELWKKHAWARRMYPTPHDLKTNVMRSGRAIQRADRITEKLRKLDKFNDLPGAIRNNPALKKLVTAGNAASIAVDLVKGRRIDDAAIKAAVQTAASAGGAAAGGAACGTAAAATFGLGAATCPVLTTTFSVGAGWVAGKLYDPLKPVVKDGVKVLKYTPQGQAIDKAIGGVKAVGGLIGKIG